MIVQGETATTAMAQQTHALIGMAVSSKQKRGASSTKKSATATKNMKRSSSERVPFAASQGGGDRKKARSKPPPPAAAKSIAKEDSRRRSQQTTAATTEGSTTVRELLTTLLEYTVGDKDDDDKTALPSTLERIPMQLPVLVTKYAQSDPSASAMAIRGIYEYSKMDSGGKDDGILPLLVPNGNNRRLLLLQESFRAALKSGGLNIILQTLQNIGSSYWRESGQVNEDGDSGRSDTRTIIVTCWKVIESAMNTIKNLPPSTLLLIVQSCHADLGDVCLPELVAATSASSSNTATNDGGNIQECNTANDSEKENQESQNKNENSATTGKNKRDVKSNKSKNIADKNEIAIRNNRYHQELNDCFGILSSILSVLQKSIGCEELSKDRLRSETSSIFDTCVSLLTDIGACGMGMEGNKTKSRLPSTLYAAVLSVLEQILGVLLVSCRKDLIWGQYFESLVPVCCAILSKVDASVKNNATEGAASEIQRHFRGIALRIVELIENEDKWAGLWLKCTYGIATPSQENGKPTLENDESQTADSQDCLAADDEEFVPSETGEKQHDFPIVTVGSAANETDDYSEPPKEFLFQESDDDDDDDDCDY